MIWMLPWKCTSSNEIVQDLVLSLEFNIYTYVRECDKQGETLMAFILSV